LRRHNSVIDDLCFRDMSAPPVTDATRGRRRGRGGIGKYLRARGRRGTGRPAEFVTRLNPEDENGAEEEDSGAEDQLKKYAKRQIETNAHRYEEPEVDLNSEEQSEPEVDLSSFLAKQRLTDPDLRTPHDQPTENEDDVDDSLYHITSYSSQLRPCKNRVQTIEWDESLNELKLEKESADAVRDLKSRFRQNQPKLAPSKTLREPRKVDKAEDSRHLLKPDVSVDDQELEPKVANKAEMEDFLDDLLV